MKSDRTASHDPWRENWQAAFLFSRCRKGLWTSVQLTILLQNKKTKPHYKKTQRDVKPLQTFIGARNELRKVDENSSIGVKRIHLRVYHFGQNQRSGAPNDNFRKNICSEDDLRSRIFETFVVKFLACLPLLGFSIM